MSGPKIEVAAKNVAKQLGEGPAWDAVSQTLWMVDIEEGQIINYNPASGDIKRHVIGGLVGFAIPTDKGNLIAGQGQSIVKVNPENDEVTVLATVEQGQNTRFNDAKVDASGRLWAGTMGNLVDGELPERMGSLYSLGPDLQVKKHVGDLSISNGLDWSNDNRTMYFADSKPRKVYGFEYDPEQGTISNQRDVVDYNIHVKEQTVGIPDGFTLDTEGKLWVATFFGSHVYRIDPANGQILQSLKFPTSNITSVCFGGKDLDELYVTSSVFLVDDISKEPLAGSLFRVTGLGVRGRPTNKFRE